MDSCLSYEPIYSQINQREEEKRRHQLMTLGASRRFLSILGLLGHLAIGMSLKALGVFLLPSIYLQVLQQSQQVLGGRSVIPMDELMVLLWQYWSPLSLSSPFRLWDQSLL